MRKQKYNILILLGVLALPFALSSQTRKAIPGGRYEALSGIKNARSHASAIPTSQAEKKDSTALFWNEVLHHVPAEASDISYFSKTDVDSFAKDLFLAKGIHKSSHLRENATIFYTDDLQNDLEILKKNKKRFHLIVVKDPKTIDKKMALLKDFKVLIYQADGKVNYYLLKYK